MFIFHGLHTAVWSGTRNAFRRVFTFTFLHIRTCFFCLINQTIFIQQQSGGGHFGLTGLTLSTQIHSVCTYAHKGLLPPSEMHCMKKLNFRAVSAKQHSCNTDFNSQTNLGSSHQFSCGSLNVKCQRRGSEQWTLTTTCRSGLGGTSVPFVKAWDRTELGYKRGSYHNIQGLQQQQRS